MSHPLITARRDLIAFAKRIGVTEARLASGESHDRLKFYDESFPAEKLLALNESDFETLFGQFGTCLSGEIRAGELVLLELTPEVSAAQLEQLHNDISQHKTAHFEFEVDKAALLDVRGFAAVEHRNVIMWFFSKRFESLLHSAFADPTAIEESIWRSGQCRTGLVLLTDHSVEIRGSFLSIIGMSHLSEAQDIGVASDDVANRAKQQYTACRNAVRWEQEWTTFQSPNHLNVDCKDQDDQILQVLSALAANIGLLYTADRVRQLNGDIIATYATDHLRGDVSLLSIEQLSESFSASSAQAIRSIADWAYGEQWQPDRVRMVQVSVARTLSGPQPQSPDVLLARAETIRDDVLWHWKTFISQKVDRYVSEERELETEVAETVDGFESQVAEMIKSLSDTMLAAIGVLIGSFIAAAFQKEFNGTIFRIGMVAYMIYLAAFPGVYNMVHHLLRFRALHAIFLKRRSRFSKILGDDVTDEVVANDIANATGRFWIWFRVTVFALCFVLVLSIIAATAVPRAFATPPSKDDANTELGNSYRDTAYS